MADEKKIHLRQILRECRAALSAARAEELSCAVQERVLTLELYKSASTVVLYAAKDNEVLTERILAHALSSGRGVYYPKLDLSQGRLLLLRVADPALELRPGAYGIREPIGTDALNPSALDDALVCVPGLGFDASGQRLGRGGGHYDRLIACMGPTATTVGLAYSFQLLEAPPSQQHDQPLDFVITESAAHIAGHGRSGRWRKAHEGGVPRCNC